MVYSELPTLSLLQSWGRQEFLTSRVGISPHMIQETLSLLSSLAVQREIVSVSGLPGLITLITLPVKVDHREKRERREWVRGGRSVNRSAVSECGPGAGSCDLAAVIWVTHGLSLGSLMAQPWESQQPRVEPWEILRCMVSGGVLCILDVFGFFE